MIDKDDSGTLDKAEIVDAVKNDKKVIKFLCNCGNQNLQYLLVPSRLDKALAEMDTDRDGTIDADEWEQCIEIALQNKLAARAASLFCSAISMHCSHSSASMVPSRSVSISASALSRRDGTSKYCRFWLPQLQRNLITFLSFFTASTISALSSVPESSLSIIWKTSRAAFKNSSVNSASARSAARWRRSRSSASCSRRLARPRLMAASPV